MEMRKNGCCPTHLFSLLSLPFYMPIVSNPISTGPRSTLLPLSQLLPCNTKLACPSSLPLHLPDSSTYLHPTEQSPYGADVLTEWLWTLETLVHLSKGVGVGLALHCLGCDCRSDPGWSGLFGILAAQWCLAADVLPDPLPKHAAGEKSHQVPAALSRLFCTPYT